MFAAAGGDPTVAHCCAADVPVGLLRGAGAGAVSLDVTDLPATAYDELATVLDEGDRVLLGVVPSTGDAPPRRSAVVDRVVRLLDMLGYDPAEVADQLVLTPACGLAGATPAYARAAMRALREAAAELAEP